MPPHLRTAFLVVFSQTLASCATQSIDALGTPDPSTAARISADSAFNFMPSVVVVMNEVDGIPIQKTVSRVAVSPGHHKLAVTCQWLSGNVPAVYRQTLELDAVPKGTYHLGVKVGGSAGPCEAVAVKTN